MKVKEIFEKIKKEIERSCEKKLFDEESRKEEVMKLRQKVVEENYGLPESYKVICDETNNTPEDIENGVVNVTILEDEE
jgi:hypothetical protein